MNFIRALTFGFCVLYIAGHWISGIFNFLYKSFQEVRQDAIVQVQSQQKVINQKSSQTKKENVFVKITEQNGKYGKFITFLDQEDLDFAHSEIFAKVINVYEKCHSDMPYCLKIEGVALSCDKREYVYLGYVTYKNKELVNDVRENKFKRKKLSSSKIISSVVNHVCNLPQVKRDTATPSVEATPQNYNPVYAPLPRGRTLCRDGTYSYSTGRGTCSHHGGIAP